jgi:F0F1-type ATP synthase epsilon subunit
MENKVRLLTRTVTVAGGFAVVQPNSVLSINAVEGYPIEDFSSEAIKAQIAEAQKVASGNGSEQDIAEAKIELEVRFPGYPLDLQNADNLQVLESLQAYVK